MPPFAKTILRLCGGAAAGWNRQHMPRMGAALAFYTLFALAPLFVILLALASLWLGEEAAQQELAARLSGLVGTSAAKAIEAIVGAAHRDRAGGWAMLVASIMLFINATSVFVHLRGALNFVWGVERPPGRGLRDLIIDRLLAFAFILIMGSILLGSLIVGTGLSAMDEFMGGTLRKDQLLWRGMHYAVSFGATTLLFAMVFKILPSERIRWRDVWGGAIVSTLLFNLGRILFGYYLEYSSVTSAYGAAGSLVITLLWVYYSAQILLFGAKFTRLYAESHGSRRGQAAEGKGDDRGVAHESGRKAHPGKRG